MCINTFAGMYYSLSQFAYALSILINIISHPHMLWLCWKTPVSFSVKQQREAEVLSAVVESTSEKKVFQGFSYPRFVPGTFIQSCYELPIAALLNVDEL